MYIRSSTLNMKQERTKIVWRPPRMKSLSDYVSRNIPCLRDSV